MEKEEQTFKVQKLTFDKSSQEHNEKHTQNFITDFPTIISELNYGTYAYFLNRESDILYIACLTGLTDMKIVESLILNKVIEFLPLEIIIFKKLRKNCKTSNVRNIDLEIFERVVLTLYHFDVFLSDYLLVLNETLVSISSERDQVKYFLNLFKEKNHNEDLIADVILQRSQTLKFL